MTKLSLNKIGKSLLDTIFPIECISCGRDSVWLCDRCLAKIYLRKIDTCPVCKKASSYGKTHEWCESKTCLDGMIVAVNFRDKILQDAIHKMKYNYIKDLSTPLSEKLADKINEQLSLNDSPNWVSILLSEKPIIVPVPLHKRRERMRDFNQAELLSQKISEKFGLEHKNDILRRVKHTKPQTKLKRNERLTNVRGKFKVCDGWKDKLKNTKIILVDDVATTGATLNECACELKKCGAGEVWGLVIARG